MSKINYKQIREESIQPDNNILMLSTYDAMALLGVSRQGLYNLINQGRLRSIKIGSHRKFTKAALLDFVKKAEVEAGQ